jgi:F-type H+-transporting ATPase subunit alpha
VPLDKQVVAIYAGTNGFLDKVPVDRVSAWEEGFYSFLDANHPGIGQGILRDKRLDDTSADGLRVALSDFNKQFLA